MNTIIDVIENRIESGKARNTFTYLEDGENAKHTASLIEIRKKALKISSTLVRNKAVLILLPQGMSFIEAFFGCLYAQAVAVPLSVPAKNRGLEKLQNVIQDAEISQAITNRKILNNLKKWFGEQFLGDINWLLIDELVELEIAPLFDFPKTKQIAYLQYTSGTTSVPKGVMISHENIIANSKIIKECFQNNEDSVSVCWLPSFHDMGLIDGILQPIYSNFRSVFMSPLHFLQRPVRWFNAISLNNATYSGGPNFAFDFCTERVKEEELEQINLSSLQCLYNGSESVRADTIHKFVDRFSKVGFKKEKIFTCYGLAEATLAVTTSKLGNFPNIIKVDKNKTKEKTIEFGNKKTSSKIVSCGKVYKDTIIKIVNTLTLKKCQENEIGEIFVAGKSVAEGYLNKPEETAETFINIGNERFLRTGDLGFLDENELFVTGRIKDLIIIRGKNHFPQDIEKTVSNSHSALQKNACAAFSFENELDEKLVVVQEIKRTFLQDVNLEIVQDSILKNISNNHGLRAFEIVFIKPSSLPKTSSGKIRRMECRRLWELGELKVLTDFKNKYEK